MRNLFLIVISTMSFVYGCSSSDESPTLKKLEEQYFSALDKWVESGGVVDDIQDVVVENCGKLVMVTVGAKEKVALTTIDREEFHFRVNVCTKITVNRVHPQPEFGNTEIVKVICKESKTALFKKLCLRSGLI